MQWNTLRTNAAAFAAIRTTPRHMERADNMEHVFFKRIYIRFAADAGIVVVKHTFETRAGRAYVPAGIAANTLG